MKKALGLLGALAVVASISLPAAAAPGGPCAGQVDASCTYNDPQAGQRVCDYWLNDGTLYRKHCGEIPNIGPIL